LRLNVFSSNQMLTTILLIYKFEQKQISMLDFFNYKFKAMFIHIETKKCMLVFILFQRSHKFINLKTNQTRPTAAV